jgi:hypothetical protein
MVPKAGFEPARVSPHAPQTCVSAIPPLRRREMRIIVLVGDGVNSGSRMPDFTNCTGSLLLTLLGLLSRIRQHHVTKNCRVF